MLARTDVVLVHASAPSMTLTLASVATIRVSHSFETRLSANCAPRVIPAQRETSPALRRLRSGPEWPTPPPRASEEIVAVASPFQYTDASKRAATSARTSADAVG